jgi:hypothetical protein
MNRWKREQLKNQNREQMKGSVLGDINPTPRPRQSSEPSGDTDKNEESMHGGSRHDRTEHSGSRDVTEGTTGGTGTETGGTRNYRTGTGATGGDIGNRPE